MDHIVITEATLDDLSDIFRIYDHYVTTSHVTFDITPNSNSERLKWFAQFDPSGQHRLLIARRAGEVVGFATSKPFRAKPAYAISVETTVYVAPNHHGRGIGRELLVDLIAKLGKAGVHRAYAGIALPNPASIAMHERLGFKRVGTFREVGFKFDQYWDVDWFEFEINL